MRKYIFRHILSPPPEILPALCRVNLRRAVHSSSLYPASHKTVHARSQFLPCQGHELCTAHTLCLAQSWQAGKIRTLRPELIGQVCPLLFSNNAVFITPRVSRKYSRLNDCSLPARYELGLVSMGNGRKRSTGTNERQRGFFMVEKTRHKRKREGDSSAIAQIIALRKNKRPRETKPKITLEHPQLTKAHNTNG